MAHMVWICLSFSGPVIPKIPSVLLQQERMKKLPLESGSTLLKLLSFNNCMCSDFFHWQLTLVLISTSGDQWLQSHLNILGKISYGSELGDDISRSTYNMSRDKTKPTKWVCAQQRLRSAWASAQSDQSLRCLHEETLGPWLPIERTVKTLIRLGGCPGWSESSLGSFCWFCHVMAHMLNIYLYGKLAFL